jgi:hypothetical protein
MRGWWSRQRSPYILQTNAGLGQREKYGNLAKLRVVYSCCTLSPSQGVREPDKRPSP